MSYSGHEQCLCKNGHLSYRDAYWEYECTEEEMREFPQGKCPYEECDASIVWVNHVDDTNCEAWGEIGMDPFKISDEVWETCECCGTRLLKKEATYRIPSKEEIRNSRTYVSSTDGKTHFCGVPT